MTLFVLQRAILSVLIFTALVAGAKVFVAQFEIRVRKRMQRTKLPIKIQSGIPLLLYFWSETCAQCKPQERQIERAQDAVRNSGQSLTVQKLNALREQELARTLGILTVPTTVLFDSSGNIAAWNPGLTPASTIVSQFFSAQQKTQHGISDPATKQSGETPPNHLALDANSRYHLGRIARSFSFLQPSRTHEDGRLNIS